MFIEVLKSKIHRVKITESNIDYIGSITIDPILMRAANMIAGEKVQILNLSNGERLETYIIEGSKAGQIGINGPAAMKMNTGDLVIIISYASMSSEDASRYQAKIIFPNETNNLI